MVEGNEVHLNKEFVMVSITRLSTLLGRPINMSNSYIACSVNR